MNIYLVTGQVVRTKDTFCDECGDLHTHERQHQLKRQVEAGTPEQAMEQALEQERESWRASDWEVNWNYPSEKRAEFLREISEAELLRQAGQPTLL